MFGRFFKRRTGSNKKVVLKNDNHVHSDWLIALLVFVLMLLFVIALSAFIFIQTNREVEVIAQPVQGEEIVDQALLQRRVLFLCGLL